MKEEFRWLVDTVVVVAFVLYFLSYVFNIEFNERAHAEIEIYGNNKVTIWDSYSFCPVWNETNLFKINIGNFGNDCYDSDIWLDPIENRVTFYFSNQVNLLEVDKFNMRVKIQFIEDRKSLVVVKGEGYP